LTIHKSQVNEQLASNTKKENLEQSIGVTLQGGRSCEKKEKALWWGSKNRKKKMCTEEGGKQPCQGNIQLAGKEMRFKRFWGGGRWWLTHWHKRLGEGGRAATGGKKKKKKEMLGDLRNTKYVEGGNDPRNQRGGADYSIKTGIHRNEGWGNSWEARLFVRKCKSRRGKRANRPEDRRQRIGDGFHDPAMERENMDREV